MKQPGSLWELKPTVHVLCQTSKIAKSEMGEVVLFFFFFSQKKQHQIKAAPPPPCLGDAVKM